MYKPAKVTLLDRGHVQKIRMEVTILIGNADNATMRHGDLHYGVYGYTPAGPSADVEKSF